MANPQKTHLQRGRSRGHHTQPIQGGWNPGRCYKSRDSRVNVVKSSHSSYGKKYGEKYSKDFTHKETKQFLVDNGYQRLCFSNQITYCHDTAEDNHVQQEHFHGGSNNVSNVSNLKTSGSNVGVKPGSVRDNKLVKHVDKDNFTGLCYFSTYFACEGVVNS